ncbi:hypothetical protein TWF281_010870 [Arthrobotrys megalospora]
MSSITAADRYSLWRIKIHTNDSTELQLTCSDIKAGFVCCDGLSVSTKTIFEDLRIVYPSLHTCPDGFILTLWREPGDGSLVFTSIADEEEIFTMTTDDVSDILLGLIFHHQNHPSCKRLPENASLAEHVLAGCAIVPTLDFDPEENGYLPDNLNYYIPSARSSRPSSPSKKRKWTEDSTSRPWTPDSLEFARGRNRESREFVERLGVDTGWFDDRVKAAYSECVITRTSSKWGSLTCGPGYVAAHIVPQRFWFSYPDWRPSSDFTNYPFNVIPSYNTDETSLRKRMVSTWSATNGLLLRADIHEMFDRRAIAIHPVTFRIRLFAPMPVAMEYHGREVEWRVPPDRAALAHHYHQCVIENVAAGSAFGSRLVVPRNWKRVISAISQSALADRSLQELEEKGRGGCTDDEVGYHLEDRLAKGREEEIASWLEKFND